MMQYIDINIYHNFHLSTDFWSALGSIGSILGGIGSLLVFGYALKRDKDQDGREIENLKQSLIAEMSANIENVFSISGGADIQFDSYENLRDNYQSSIRSRESLSLIENLYQSLRDGFIKTNKQESTERAILQVQTLVNPMLEYFNEDKVDIPADRGNDESAFNEEYVKPSIEKKVANKQIWLNRYREILNKMMAV